jgi:hypothetical protein
MSEHETGLLTRITGFVLFVAYLAFLTYAALRIAGVPLVAYD